MRPSSAGMHSCPLRIVSPLIAFTAPPSCVSRSIVDTRQPADRQTDSSPSRRMLAQSRVYLLHSIRVCLGHRTTLFASFSRKWSQIFLQTIVPIDFNSTEPSSTSSDDEKSLLREHVVGMLCESAGVGGNLGWEGGRAVAVGERARARSLADTSLKIVWGRERCLANTSSPD